MPLNKIKFSQQPDIKEYIKYKVCYATYLNKMLSWAYISKELLIFWVCDWYVLQSDF